MNELLRLADKLESDAKRDLLLSVSAVVTSTRKYSGQAKVNTKVGLNRPNASLTMAVPYQRNFFSFATGQSIGEARRVLQGFQLGNTVFISNNLHYINILEHVRGDKMFSHGMRVLNG